jgi:pimeloyl-ACP methyl ester carboxylesterase
MRKDLENIDFLPGKTAAWTVLLMQISCKYEVAAGRCHARAIIPALQGAGMTDIGHFEPDDLKSIPTFRAAYSDRTALLMARLAYRAYDAFDVDDKSWKTFSDAVCGSGFGGCERLIASDIGTAGYVAEGDDIIVVVFRGTENRLDWMTNVNTRFVTLQGGTRIHTGFFQAYWPIREAMFDFLVAALKKKKRAVYITGHSLGGALALMATAELANHDDAEIRDSIAACYHLWMPARRRQLVRSLCEGAALPHHPRRRSRARGSSGASRIPACRRHALFRQARNRAVATLAQYLSKSLAHAVGPDVAPENLPAPEYRGPRHGGLSRQIVGLGGAEHRGNPRAACGNGRSGNLFREIAGAPGVLTSTLPEGLGLRATEPRAASIRPSR